jgi:hypothetical protein
MEEKPVSIQGIGIKFGLITAAICIVYFLVMSMAGLIHIIALRMFNYAFIAAGIFLALNEVTHKIHKHRVNYLPGLGIGFTISLFTAIAFSVFMFVYSKFININFIPSIKPMLPDYYGDLNPYMLGVFVFSESLMFGAVLSFIVMQFFKRNRSADNEALEEAEEKKTIKLHHHHS